jgi:hypothetical protein
MTRSQLALALSMVLAVGACAQQPPKNSPRVAEQAARWGVSPYLLVTAENRGYWPQIREGKVFFCRSAAVIGSNIASEECLDAGLIAGRLGREQDEQRRSQDALQKGQGYCIPTSVLGC